LYTIIHHDTPDYKRHLSILYSKQKWQDPLYLPVTEQYIEIYGKEKGLFENISFILIYKNKPIYAFLGVVSDTQFHIPSISLTDEKNFISRAKIIVNDEFNRIFKICNGIIYFRDYVINDKLSSTSYLMLKTGAIIHPFFSRVIDINQPEAKLKSNIRKSYKSLINSGLRELGPQIFCSSNITLEKMMEFRKLHILEAGRETRSEASWRCQLEMIQKNEAFAVFGYLAGELLTAGLFLVSNNNCVYAASASRRDKFDKPMFHASMWTAILYAKEIGCHWFEVGEQLYENHFADKQPTAKELGISTFKAGFGGETRMFLDLQLKINI